MHLIAVLNKFYTLLLLPIACWAVGCSKAASLPDGSDAPLPIELNFTLSDPSGNNLLDPSVEGAISREDISVVYNVSSYFPDQEKDGLLLSTIYNHEQVPVSLSFGQLDGSMTLEGAPVTLVAGPHTFTVMVTNVYHPGRDVTAERHFYWHNQDWYGKSAIPLVIGEETEEHREKQLI